MFFDTVLKYILPEAVTAWQRVAVRPAAVFVAALVIACLLAFGQDAFGIISYEVSGWVGLEESDLPQTAAALSVVALVLLFGLAGLFYAHRAGLVWFWSGCWRPYLGWKVPPYEDRLFSYILTHLDAAKELAKQRRTEEANKRRNAVQEATSARQRARDLQARINQVADLKNSALIQIPGDPRPLPSQARLRRLRSIARGAAWIVAFLAVVAIDLIWLGLVSAYALLFRLIAASSIRQAQGVQSQATAESAALSPKRAPYRRKRTDDRKKLVAILTELRDALEKLHRYVSTPSSAPPRRTEDKEGALALPIEALALEATVVDKFRDIIQEFEKGQRSANGGGLQATSRHQVNREIRTLIGGLEAFVLDAPEFPTSRLKKAKFHPGARLGFVLERSSLGLGRVELKKREGSTYFGSAQNEKGDESSPGRLTEGPLAQCIDLREQVYSSLIGATLAGLAAILIGVFGPLLSLPNPRHLLLWLGLGLVMAFYVKWELDRASIAGAKLCSVESWLWQTSFFGEAATAKPKRIIWRLPPWRPQLKHESLRTARRVLVIFVVSMMISFVAFKPHRIYQVKYADQGIEPKTTLTSDNINVLLKSRPERRTDGDPMPVRSASDLIGSTFPVGCAEKRAIGRPTTEMLEHDCQPVIGWKEKEKEGQSSGVTVSIHDLTIPAPVLRYSGQPRSVPLEAEPPYVWFNDKAVTSSLNARSPYVWFKDPAETGPLLAQSPFIEYTGAATPAVLAASPPFIHYMGNSESTWLAVAKPYFDYLEDTDTGISWSLGSFPRRVAFGASPGVLPPLEVHPPMFSWTKAENVIPDYPHVVPLNGVSLWFRVYCPTPTRPPYANPKLCKDAGDDLGLDAGLNAWMKTSWTDVQDLVHYAKIAEKTDDKPRSFLVIGHADKPRQGPDNNLLAEARVDFAMNLLKCSGVEENEILRFKSDPASPWVPQTDARESQSLNRRVDIYLIEGGLDNGPANQEGVQSASVDEMSVPKACPNDIGVLSHGP
jgi:hypothetical protein